MLRYKKNQKGMSLIELMISLAIGQILTGAMIALYVTSVKGNIDNLTASALNQDMQAMLRLISRDVRRAGFWAGVPGGADDLAANPFMSNVNDFDISEKSTEDPVDSNSCVRYSYDLNKDKAVDVGIVATAAPFNATPYGSGAVEQFGFRKHETLLQMRTGLSSASETTFNCDDGAWTTITGSNIEITAMTFTLTTQFLNVNDGTSCDDITLCCATAGQSCQWIRSVEIIITGRLKNDLKLVKTVSAITRIRNDRYVVI